MRCSALVSVCECVRARGQHTSARAHLIIKQLQHAHDDDGALGGWVKGKREGGRGEVVSAAACAAQGRAAEADNGRASCIPHALHPTPAISHPSTPTHPPANPPTHPPTCTFWDMWVKTGVNTRSVSMMTSPVTKPASGVLALRPSAGGGGSC